MIKVSLENIQTFDLPLDTTEKITKRGESKRILKELEKKYGLKSHYECRKNQGKYMLYANPSNYYVLKEDKEAWIKNYEIYVRSSVEYRFWVAVHKLCKFMKV